jgi:hypothetical protein
MNKERYLNGEDKTGRRKNGVLKTSKHALVSNSLPPASDHNCPAFHFLLNFVISFMTSI